MLEFFKSITSINLRMLLKNKNINQAQLSRMTGISTSTINDYVKGKTIISKRNIEKITTALDITIYDLVKYSFFDVKDLSQEYVVVKLLENKTLDIFSPYENLKIAESSKVEQYLFSKGDQLLLEKKDKYETDDILCYYHKESNHYKIDTYTQDNQLEIIGKIVMRISIM
ncbi:MULTISPECIES: helix-turn-helix transcriptional regulator [unclassified Granulicatella]|uniref:helix-turn-helix domain-containing protein n=1 Tax=unclassified Granulicatella TaxID=2630493 RepID=UPI001073F32D|nr:MULTISPECIES: helix-turn-helix transcriptional regulator [unclassified Granulicatella]MBF0779690.1 helix-turn-helix transcriptional regulator [Granulicatella sp. 19428wC4_WM01]TFU96343.1 XRE family transcriptional regulator [Granulicatella sp. WM01]